MTRIESQIRDLLELARGKRVALLTNPTGVDGDYRLLADRLAEDPDITVTAFFAPEHGLRGDQQAGAKVLDYVDQRTGVPVFSLHGDRRAPGLDQLADCDALIFDIQDVGARFYTYVWTMTKAMEAAAEAGVPFLVFDRPNPIGLERVEGPPNRMDCGMVGRKWENAPFGVATRHGMTPGELAQLVNEEWLTRRAALSIITIPDHTRGEPFSQTEYPWVSPSPNMPTLDTAAVFPGTCLFEGTNLSEGRGTTRPFELVGAPWIDAFQLVNDMNEQRLPGVRFREAQFRPTFSKHAGELCGGVQLHVTDVDAFRPILTGFMLLERILRLWPRQTETRPFLSRLAGIADLHERILADGAIKLADAWQNDLQAFRALRERHLIYPE